MQARKRWILIQSALSACIRSQVQVSHQGAQWVNREVRPDGAVQSCEGQVRLRGSCRISAGKAGGSIYREAYEVWTSQVQNRREFGPLPIV